MPFDTRVPVTCSTNGATTWTFTPSADDRYHDFVPRNAVSEEAYGHDGSDGIFVCGSDDRLEGNVTSRNGGDGIGFALVQQRNHLVANQSQGNTGGWFDINAGLDSTGRHEIRPPDMSRPG